MTRARPLLLMAALVAAYVVAFVDRQIPALMVEPMKRALRLSDVDISLLYGLSFAIMISAAAVPMGMLVDRRPRLTLMAVGMLISSAMTAASAFADGFAALLLYRCMIGCGQAVLTPASHSLIADHFPVRRMGLALGIFGIAPYLGTGAAYIAGSAAVTFVDRQPAWFLAQWGIESWQAVLLLVGVPGLPLALWLLTLPETARSTSRSSIEPPDLAAILHFFRRNAAGFFFLKLATAFASMATYAVTAWYPTFLIRHFHWTIAQAGTAVGLCVMGAGTVGAITGGMIGDWAATRYASGRLRTMAVAALFAAPFAAMAPLTDDAMAGLALIGCAMALATGVIGINPSATMAMMPRTMRGLASGLGVLIVNLIGFSLGPMLVAGCTDYWLRDPALLHHSLSALLPVMLLTSAACAFLAIKPYDLSIRTRPPLQPVTA